MAWIESHETLAQHPKTKKFARALGESLPSAVGRLHFLWWWAMKYAEDGDLSKYEDADIADAVAWDGEPSVVVNALCECGFIDRDDDVLQIHDWDDYAGRLIDKRKENAERMRAARAEKKNKRAKNVRRTCNERAGATVPNQTVPNQTVPNQTKEREIAVQQIVNAYEETFGPLRGEPSQLMTLLDYMDKGMELELITTAIHKSSNAEVPLKYADKILANQLRKGIKTVKEAMEESSGGMDVELTVNSRRNQGTRRPDDNPKKSITGGQIGWIAPRESS